MGVGQSMEGRGAGELSLGVFELLDKTSAQPGLPKVPPALGETSGTTDRLVKWYLMFPRLSGSIC